MNNQDPLEIFVAKLLEERGVMAHIDDEVKKELIISMKQQLEEIINRNMIAELDDESVQQFSDLLESENNIDEINNFFYNRKIDTTQIIARSLQKFREAYIGSR